MLAALCIELLANESAVLALSIACQSFSGSKLSGAAGADWAFLRMYIDLRQNMTAASPIKPHTASGTAMAVADGRDEACDSAVAPAAPGVKTGNKAGELPLIIPLGALVSVPDMEAINGYWLVGYAVGISLFVSLAWSEMRRSACVLHSEQY